jgi:selenocysteine lyase/cysteine desulfurase
MLLENQKSLFNLPPEVTFLNCANMSPLLNAVNYAGKEAIDKRNTPWEIKTDDWFKPAEELRSLVAGLINTDSNNIALIPSASYGLSVAAKNISLTDKQEIIVLDQQYPSNVYVWLERSSATGARIITIERQGDQTWTEAILEKISNATGLIAIPNCHWTDGSLIDLEKVSEAAKKVDAKLVIDASQSLGAYPLDVKNLKPDFVISVGYKWLLGPYGTSYLYADEKYFSGGKPIEYSWLNRKGSEDFTKLVNYTDEFKAGARRFDAGGFPSFINIPMAIAALKQITTWGVTHIQQTLSELTRQIESQAEEIGLETPQRLSRVGHMIGIKFSESEVSRLTKLLTSEKIIVSFRGSSMRVAPHLYNDKQDIEKLFKCLVN